MANEGAGPGGETLPPPAGPVRTLPASAIGRLAGRCRQAIDALSIFMAYMAGWAFVFCGFYILFEIFARNVLGTSTNSTIEVSGYVLAVGMSWGCSHALAQRSHVRIDVVINLLPPSIRQWLHLASLALLSLFAGVLAKGAFDVTMESQLFGSHDMSMLEIPLVIPQSLWTAGFVILFVQTIFMFIENLSLVLERQGAVAERNLQARSYTEEADEALAALDEVSPSPAGKRGRS